MKKMIRLIYIFLTENLQKIDMFLSKITIENINIVGWRLREGG